MMFHRRATIFLLACFSASWDASMKVQAFSIKPLSQELSTKLPSRTFNHVSRLSVAARGNEEIGTFESAALKSEDLKPIIKFGSGANEKVVNAFGLWTLIVSLITCPIWYVSLKIVNAINTMNDDFDPNRAIYDYTGKIWSKVWLSLTLSYPEITGEVDQIKEREGACLYVANHASWLDIPIVCTVLDPVFKFISKGSLKSLPCIGDQLSGGNHILIDREDRRSQLRTFKEGISWLKKGVPLMAFPEGQRSQDGRLMSFKGGAFSMAVREKVPIVPITIANAYATMPSNAFFPVQKGDGNLSVHIHPAIDVEGKSEEELEDLVRTAILLKLPLDQHPLPKIAEDDGKPEEKVNKL